MIYIDKILFYRCCIETYEKGVQNVSSDMKKRNLMILLTEHIVKIWQINKSINNWDVNVLVKRKMKNVFQMAHFDFGGVLEPEFYVYWVGFVSIIIYCKL